MSEVRLLSSWDGYCGPCDDERPLALTETGPFGFRAWRTGTRPADRVLTLICRLCGQWQIVARDEREDPAVVLVPEPEVAPFVLAAQQAPVWQEPVTEQDEQPGVAGYQAPAEPAYPPVYEPPLQPAYEVSTLHPPAEPAPGPPVTHPIALSPAPPLVPPPSYEPAPFQPAASYEPVHVVAPQEYAPVPVPRLQPVSAPEGADLSTVLELLSQGLELAGPGATDRA
ncbi:MAG: hypothetical protein JWN57_3014 [Frankiales bacterium]|jgi:hypothetical protein|nr:hypothetical protein [Frankiales bacterium]